MTRKIIVKSNNPKRPDVTIVISDKDEIDGNVFLSDLGLTELPDLSGVTVTGDFDCNYNQLISLLGAPEKVAGDFNCYKNQLTSLEHVPKEVGGNFDCSSNQLTSLLGAPEKVGKNFNCNNNQLTSLLGIPEKIGGKIWCDNKRLLKKYFAEKAEQEEPQEKEAVAAKQKEAMNTANRKLRAATFRRETNKIWSKLQQMFKPNSGNEM